MRVSTFLTAAIATVAAAATLPTAADKDSYDLAAPQGRENGLQIPIGDNTRTRTVTETQTFFETVETVYMTRSKAVPTMVPAPKKQKATVPCDETKEISCAICRTIHGCAGLEAGEECVACDTAPDCVACQPPDEGEPPQQTASPSFVHLGVTCSLGPGRTVPCELVDKEGLRGPVYRFGDDD